MTDMLNGRKVIKAEFILALCQALGVTPNRLFQWDGRGT
ncbi:MAG: helix-turn-helix domain-containing protein [Pseudoflavonifractor capillosus]|nr:helix-turn-helix domain-containing protein [Pseudoflavonifractor capillosus]